MQGFFAQRIAIAAMVIGMELLAGGDYAAAQTGRASLNISDAVWASLNPQQRDAVLARYAVEVVDKNRFARVIDIQGVNESTPGTTGGAQLGSLLGQTQYIDKTNWQTYSATKQVGWGLLGALVGAMADAPARAAYRIVYTLRGADGSVRTVERISQSPIHVALGLCVDTASFTPVQDDYCENRIPQEIRTVLGVLPPGTAPIGITPDSTPAPTGFGASPPHTSSGIVATDVILCRLGPTSTVSTTAEKCLQAGGSIQP